MDSYWRAKSLHGITAHAKVCSLPQFRAWPSPGKAIEHASRHIPIMSASAASETFRCSSACPSLHSAPTYRQRQDVCSQSSNVRPGARTSRAACQAQRPCLLSTSSSPKRRASIARGPARGSVAASAGAGSLMDVFQAIQAQMQGMAASDEPPLADVDVSHMAFHPAGMFNLYRIRPKHSSRACEGKVCTICDGMSAGAL